MNTIIRAHIICHNVHIVVRHIAVLAVLVLVLQENHGLRVSHAAHCKRVLLCSGYSREENHSVRLSAVADRQTESSRTTSGRKSTATTVKYQLVA